MAKTYTGFTENTTYSGRVASGTIAGDGSLILKLYYDRNTYTVTLDANGGTINSGDITDYTYGVGANLPTDVTRTNYVFRGWYNNSSLTGTAITSIGISETGDKTYWAKWLVDTDGDGIPDEEDTDTKVSYKVEHYKQNTDLSSYTKAEEETLQGDYNTQVTATAKTYTGFSENTSYTDRKASGTVTVDASFVGNLVLKLYYDRETYTVTLNENDGTINSGDVTDYTYGIGTTLPTDVTKTGYTFSGWYEDSSFSGSAVTSIGTTDIGNKEYFAKWTANTNTPYKVEHYRRNLDSEVIGYDLYETEELTGTTDEIVTATAKTYTGFTENTTYSGRVASGTIAGAGSLVLKLYYDRNTYNITYNLNGGIATSTLTPTYVYGKELILSNKVEKQGYKFKGWYDNISLTGTAVISISATETGDKTFYAKWVKEDEYNISSDKYEIQDSYITKVSPNTSVDTFLSNINTNGTMKVFNTQGNEITGSTLVGTGATLQVEFNGTKHEYVIVVRGDIDGNGKITVTDLSMLNQVLVKKLTVTGVKEKATDIDYSKKITVTDLSMMNQALVGKINL